MIDKLGDRMKLYENMACNGRFMPLLPIVARIDGRAFSSFTRGMKRPYDADMSSLMIDTTMYLVKETNACMGYTQSDEITLAWYHNNAKSQVWFDGRITKMTSQLAAHATLWFNRLLADERMPKYLDRLPTFDARVWQVPNKTEGANVFVWREWDATKNSISMAAHSVYSNKELFGKNSSQKQEMLWQKGINWNDYPIFFKRGTYVQKQQISRSFTSSEMDVLPPKHAARLNPNLMVERSEFRVMEFPVLTTIINREAVIFDGAIPIMEKSN